MASASQLLVLRLRSGGVLVVAPATVLPWPRVVGRKLRRLQEVGLHMALADPQGMQRLRRELPRMLNLPVTRGALPDDDRALSQVLLRAARTGELTLMYGHAETSLREGGQHELSERFSEKLMVAPLSDTVRSSAAGRELPGSTDALPRDTDGRFRWVCARAPTHLQPDLVVTMREFFSPEMIPTTAALLTIWAGTQEAGAGFTVDAAMFATATWQLGTDASLAFDALADTFELVGRAAHWLDLDRAAVRLAAAATTLRPGLLRQFLCRIADSAAEQGQSV